MTSSTARRTDTDKHRGEQESLTASRAAGYCWARNPNGPGRCTRPPHNDRNHVDYYTGRKAITDMKGAEWTS